MAPPFWMVQENRLADILINILNEIKSDEKTPQSLDPVLRVNFSSQE